MVHREITAPGEPAERSPVLVMPGPQTIYVDAEGPAPEDE
jgi:hypothetical protein